VARSTEAPAPAQPPAAPEIDQSAPDEKSDAALPDGPVTDAESGMLTFDQQPDTIQPMPKKEPTISETLRAAIKASSLSLGFISDKTEIDKAVLSRFINRKGGLSMEGIDAIGKLLGVKTTISRKSRDAK
jgi:hypothetical protein